MIKTRFPLKKALYEGERCFVIEFTKDTTRKELYDGIVNTYDPIPEGWSREGNLIDSIKIRGKIEKLEGTRDYSSTFRYTIKKKPGRSIRVYTEIKSFCNDSNTYHLVITLSRKGKNLKYHSVDLQSFEPDANGWKTGFAFQEFSRRNLRHGDEIMVYCWNSGKNETIYLDDFFLKLSTK